jgi:hypothetical protein
MTKYLHISSYIRKPFLIEIQMGSVAKAYMRNGFLIYEEMRKYIFSHILGGR